MNTCLLQKLSGLSACMVLSTIQEYNSIHTVIWNFPVQLNEQLTQKKYHYIGVCVGVVHREEHLSISVQCGNKRQPWNYLLFGNSAW